MEAECGSSIRKISVCSTEHGSPRSRTVSESRLPPKVRVRPCSELLTNAPGVRDDVRGGVHGNARGDSPPHERTPPGAPARAASSRQHTTGGDDWKAPFSGRRTGSRIVGTNLRAGGYLYY